MAKRGKAAFTHWGWAAGLLGLGAGAAVVAVVLNKKSSSAAPAPAPVTATGPATSPAPVVTTLSMTNGHRYAVTVTASAAFTGAPSVSHLQTMLGSKFTVVSATVPTLVPNTASILVDYVGQTGTVPMSDFGAALGSILPAGATWKVSATDSGPAPNINSNPV